jgi:4-hydroxy-3-polyprenylbenzoate decarboxylase
MDKMESKRDSIKDRQPQGGLGVPRVLVGISGASGSLYAQHLILKLLAQKVHTYVVFTPTACQVVTSELPGGFLQKLALSKSTQRFQEDADWVSQAPHWGLEPQDLTFLKKFQHDDFFAPVASGSSGATHMVILPCSMGTLARLAQGMSTQLLERAADVMLKEKRPLIVVPRETPLNLIHLRNMTTLLKAGAHLVPAMPGFYFNPKSIDELVGQFVQRILDLLELPEGDPSAKRWNLNRF